MTKTYEELLKSFEETLEAYQRSIKFLKFIIAYPEFNKTVGESIRNYEERRKNNESTNEK